MSRNKIFFSAIILIGLFILFFAFQQENHRNLKAEEKTSKITLPKASYTS